MKKKILFLASVTLLSFFFVIGATAQEKVQDAKKVIKAKTELVKKDIPKKCQACPSLTKCMGEDAKAGVVKSTADAKHVEGAACCAEKASPAELRKAKRKAKAAKQK